MEKLHNSLPEPLPPQNPHDKLFKVVFKRLRYARAFFRAVLPLEMLAKLKLETLRPSDAGQVNTNLEEDFADIQFTCDTVSGKPAEFPLILEHKSTRPTYPNYQYMHYQDGGWGWQVITKDVKPTPSVPVVLYHGKEEWEAKPWKDYLEGYDEVFASFTPPGGCIFVNLSKMPDEKIKQFKYGFMVAALLLMKHRMERDYLLEHLPEIFNFVESDPEEEDIDNRIENLKYALRYLQGLKVIKWAEARARLQHLNLIIDSMTVLEEVKLEGYEEGKAEKDLIACRNMLLKGFQPELIASVLEVTVQYVANVAKQMKKEAKVKELLLQGNHSFEQIADLLNVSALLVKIVSKELNKDKKGDT